MINYIAELNEDNWLQCIHVVESPANEGSEVVPQEGNTLWPVPGPVTAPRPYLSYEIRRIGDALVWDDSRPLAEIQTDAVNQTYKDVDYVYGVAVGNRATIYKIAESDARAYKAAGYTGPVSESIAGYARKNVATLVPQSNQWAADQIIARADAFQYAEMLMRNTMFASQVDMRLATTSAQLITAVTAWNGFISGVLAQLGLPQKGTS